MSWGHALVSHCSGLTRGEYAIKAGDMLPWCHRKAPSKHRVLDDHDADNAAIKQAAESHTASIYNSAESINRWQRCIYGSQSHKHVDKADILNLCEPKMLSQAQCRFAIRHTRATDCVSECVTQTHTHTRFDTQHSLNCDIYHFYMPSVSHYRKSAHTVYWHTQTHTRTASPVSKLTAIPLWPGSSLITVEWSWAQ